MNIDNDSRNSRNMEDSVRIPSNRIPCQEDFPYYVDWYKYKFSRSSDPANAMQRYQGPIC